MTHIKLNSLFWLWSFTLDYIINSTKR